MTTNRHGTAVRLACMAMAVTLVALLGGCAGPSTETSGGTSTSLVAPTPGAPGAAGSGSVVGAPTDQSAATPDLSKGGTGSNSASTPIQKLIVVNKTLRIETGDVQGTLTKIRTLATRDGGDITDMQVSTSVDQPVYPVQPDQTQSSGTPDSSSVPLQAFVTIRVPSSTYAAFIADAAKLGKVLFQSESSDDVTQQHVDMQARLGNLTAEQTRLRQLFSRAKNVSDMLAIEQELTRVQGDIESMKAQIAYLERQAAMATVTIQLTEPVAIGSPAGTDWGVSTALTDAIRAFVNTMNGLIVLLGPVLALLVFVGLPASLIVWLVRRSLRRRRLAHATDAGAPPAPPAPPAPTTARKPGTDS